MGLIRYFARHRTVANLLMVLMLAAGLVAATQMRAQYFPDIVLNEVDVTVAWDGAGAEEVDRAIVQLVERPARTPTDRRAGQRGAGGDRGGLRRQP